MEYYHSHADPNENYNTIAIPNIQYYTGPISQVTIGQSNYFLTLPPGEMGCGVIVVNSAMSSAEVAKREEMYYNHAFDEYVSELISLN